MKRDGGFLRTYNAQIAVDEGHHAGHGSTRLHDLGSRWSRLDI